MFVTFLKKQCPFNPLVIIHSLLNNKERKIIGAE